MSERELGVFVSAFARNMIHTLLRVCARMNGLEDLFAELQKLLPHQQLDITAVREEQLLGLEASAPEVSWNH